MELDREQIIKALECCTNCICNHAKTDTECPLVKMDFCKNYLMKQSLALIKELTEELDDAKRDTIPKLQWSLQRANEMGVELEKENAQLKAENERLRADYEKNDSEWRELYADSQSKWEKAYEKLEEENKRLQSHVNRLKKYDEERDIALHARLISETKANTAREIFEKIDKIIDEHHSGCYEYEDGDECDTAITYISYISADIDVLKKKYTEGGNK